MDTTRTGHPTARPAYRHRRPGRILLAAAGLATVLLAGACDTGQQVPWASYDSSLQTRIDAATTTGNCSVLLVLLNTAKATSEAHEKATGFPNDALVSYIQAAQVHASCPTGTG